MKIKDIVHLSNNYLTVTSANVSTLKILYKDKDKDKDDECKRIVDNINVSVKKSLRLVETLRTSDEWKKFKDIDIGDVEWLKKLQEENKWQ